VEREDLPARSQLWVDQKNQGVMSIARGFVRRPIRKEETAVEDMERTNAMQYMLMVYLDTNRWAKTPEGMRTGRQSPKRHPYPLARSESRPAMAHSIFASSEGP